MPGQQPTFFQILSSFLFGSQQQEVQEQDQKGQSSNETKPQEKKALPQEAAIANSPTATETEAGAADTTASVTQEKGRRASTVRFDDTQSTKPPLSGRKASAAAATAEKEPRPLSPLTRRPPTTPSGQTGTATATVEGTKKTLRRHSSFIGKANPPQQQRRGSAAPSYSIPTTQEEDNNLSGLTPEHARNLSEYARDNKIIIIFRPVNPESSEKLQDGYTGKGLATKGKSSEFGPIGGDIPYLAALSKVSADPKSVEYYQGKNDYEIKASDAVEESLISLTESGKNPHDIVAELKQQTLATKVAKKVTFDGKEYDLLYFEANGKRNSPANSSEIKFDEKQRPIFAIREDGDLLFYNYDINDGSGGYLKDENLAEQTKGFTAKTVEILAYKKFGVKTNEAGEEVVKLNPSPITADYDELTSGGRRLFPPKHSQEVYESFCKNLVNEAQKLGIKTNEGAWYLEYDRKREEAQKPGNEEKEVFHTEVKTKKDTATVINFLDPNLLVAYEAQSMQEALNLKNIEYVGLVNDQQRAATAFLQGETHGAKNHGGEVNNPFPEPFTNKGNYAVFTPDGKQEVLHNQQEICQFINEKRREGYLVEVNPRWGWEVVKEGDVKDNEKIGDLRVPEKPFDWKDCFSQIEQIKKDLGPNPKDEDKHILGRYNSELELTNLKLQQDQLKQFPPLVYAEAKDSTSFTTVNSRRRSSVMSNSSGAAASRRRSSTTSQENAAENNGISSAAIAKILMEKLIDQKVSFLEVAYRDKLSQYLGAYSKIPIIATALDTHDEVVKKLNQKTVEKSTEARSNETTAVGEHTEEVLRQRLDRGAVAGRGR